MTPLSILLACLALAAGLFVIGCVWLILMFFYYALRGSLGAGARIDELGRGR